MKKYLALLTILLSGCSTLEPYNVGGYKEEELVNIFGYYKKNIFSKEFNTRIRTVSLLDGTPIIETDFFNGPHDSVVLQPDSYIIEVICFRSQLSATPQVQVEITAGKYYEVYCSTEKGKNIFGFTIDAFAHAHIREIDKDAKIAELEKSKLRRPRH